jgi:serine/threonine-protein kinase
MHFERRPVPFVDDSGVWMALTAGTRFGSYTITESVGAGGMGEVYRATDSQLKRDVAIKVLPESLASDAGRLARFQREAETLAALNHSNIAQIFGLEQFAGGTALVMELVEGPTLADRIAAGPIPVDDALGIAVQIAAALEAAHAQGIVHRDLKPGNVKVRPDGTVKVLDFGIAKALETRSISGAQPAPLTTPAMTEAGMLLGTAAYMAPEQARGKVVDERADIWAFGAVLYEMLTGQPAFGGEDVTVTLARVLERPTDFELLPKGVSPAVRRTIELCLEKDLRWRVADIRDVRLVLAGRFETSAAQLAPTHTAPRRSVWPLVAGIFFGGALVGFAGLSVWPEPESKPVKRFAISLPSGQTLAAGGFDNVLDLSADGMKLVYRTAGGLRLRELATLEDRAIPGTDQAATGPVFSPDGQSVAYVSGGVIRRIATSGGSAVTILDGSVPVALSWTHDGAILFNGGRTAAIHRVPETGGMSELIVDAEGASGLSTPELLPDGDNVLFTSHATPTSPGQIYVQSVSTGERTAVISGATDARYAPTGHIVYAVGNTLFGIAFDAKTKRTRGPGVPLVQEVSRTTGTGSASLFAIANSGTLAYVRGSGTAGARTLVWVDRTGRETPIAAPARNYLYVDLSPDETQVALDIRDQENDSWVLDLERLTVQRLTFDPGSNRGVVFSPDGRRIAFSRRLGDTEEIYWQAADGSGSPAALTDGSGTPMHPIDFTPDGSALVYAKSNLPHDILMIPVAGPAGPGTPLLDGPASEGSPAVSPDGRWLAYSSDESGDYEVYVRPFPNVDAGRWQVSRGGGFHPQWSRDGTELFYLEARDPDVAMLAVSVEPGPTFRPGIPTELFAGPYFYGAVIAAPDVYDVSADGRFLMIKDADAPDGALAQPEIVIVENWFEDLKRLVPVE